MIQLDIANTEFGKCQVFTRGWVLAAESALDPAFSISTTPFKDSPWGVSVTGTSGLLWVGSHDLLLPFEHSARTDKLGADQRQYDLQTLDGK